MRMSFNSNLYAHSLTIPSFATWCGPCKVIAPQVALYVPIHSPLHHTPTNSRRYSEDATDNLKDAHYLKFDVDESPKLAANLGVRAMPTFYVFTNGDKENPKVIVGANPNAIKAAVKDALAEAAKAKEEKGL